LVERTIGACEFLNCSYLQSTGSFLEEIVTMNPSFHSSRGVYPLFTSSLATILLTLAGSPQAQTPVKFPPPSAKVIAGAPAWAYPVLLPPDSATLARPKPDTSALRKVPGSAVTLSLGNVKNLFYAPDWHPADHPTMPEVVARGRKPDVFACGFCHRADGSGAPENSSLAGLPEAYIIAQVADFKSGARQTSVPHREPVQLMTRASKAATKKEIKEAAAYFAALAPRKNLLVIESDSAPKTFVTGWHLAAAASGQKELLGQRIIEVPENLEQFVSRDARAKILVYVPVGSVAKGKVLVETGGKGKTVSCAACHGANLKGMGQFPGIAGRSPSYVVRQLYDFKHGSRKGINATLMQPTVAKLTTEDMVNLAAYLATLTP
jgi:cytochrome c553